MEKITEDKKRFGVYNKYGVDPNKPQPKPKEGKLVYKSYRGVEEVLATGSFALLNFRKQDYISKGYERERLSVRY